MPFGRRYFVITSGRRELIPYHLERLDASDAMPYLAAAVSFSGAIIAPPHVAEGVTTYSPLLYFRLMLRFYRPTARFDALARA